MKQDTCQELPMTHQKTSKILCLMITHFFFSQLMLWVLIRFALFGNPEDKFFCYEAHIRLVPSNMFKPTSNFLTDHSKAVILLWILFVICISCLSVILSCLFLEALWWPARKGPTSWLSCIWCFLVFLSLSHMVSWVRCGAWLYPFLIFASSLLCLNYKFHLPIYWKEIFYCNMYT